MTEESKAIVDGIIQRVTGVDRTELPRYVVALVESAMAAGKAAAWEEGRLAGGSHYDAIRAHFQAGESEPDPLINPYGDGKSTHSHFVVFGSQRWLCGCKFDRDHNPNGNVNYDTGIESPHEQ